MELIQKRNYKHTLLPVSNLLALGVVICSNTSLAPVQRVGFHCDDPYLQKPFSGDTVTIYWLFSVTYLAPLLIIILVEYACLYSLEKYDSNAKQCRNIYKSFASGTLYIFAVIELIKLYVGELRPHFFDSCRPDVSSVKCSEGYVTAFNCTAAGPSWLLRDIYKSFPSGHAALCFYTSIFVNLYIHLLLRKVNNSFLVFVRYFVYFFASLWAVTCSLSRIIDNRHHWWDVLVGAIIGIIGGLFMIKYFVQSKVKPAHQKIRS